jgi:hypothetical protein
MRLSVGLIFSLIVLWSTVLTAIYVIFRMVLMKEGPNRSIVDLVDISEVLPRSNATVHGNATKTPTIAIGMGYTKQSRYAYVTLLHGIDDTFSYRGFLYNCLIVKKALEDVNSKADFVVLVGFTYGTAPNSNRIVSDLRLLERAGIKLHYLPRLDDSHVQVPHDRMSSPTNKTGGEHRQKKVPFLEMALLKITPWSFTQYKRVQFFDGDVLPYQNMDCFFRLGINTFNTGNASPLNSGWYLAVPNATDFGALRSKALKRMHSKKWDEIKGWGTTIPPDKLYFRGGGKAVPKWSFNGASLDQGLFTDHFVLHEGRVQLIDTDNAREPVRVYQRGFKYDVVPIRTALDCCTGTSLQSGNDYSGSKKGKAQLPTDYFHHYTGRNKPWLQDLNRPKDASQRLWAQYLDSLHLSVNSSNIHTQTLNSPLGYFYPNK